MYVHTYVIIIVCISHSKTASKWSVLLSIISSIIPWWENFCLGAKIVPKQKTKGISWSNTHLKISIFCSIPLSYISCKYIIVQTSSCLFFLRIYECSSVHTVHTHMYLSCNADVTSKYFKEPLSVSNAYLNMIAVLDDILKGCDLSTLQSVLIHQLSTPNGIKLKKVFKKQIKKKIKEATSSSDLISVLDDFPCCNWLDTRLVEALAIGSTLKLSCDLVEAYNKFLFQKKFRDALLEFSTVPEKKIKAYVVAVSKKIHVDPDKITIGDFMKKQRTMDRAILDLKNRTLCIRNVKKGCLEFSYYIPDNCSFSAYKMALHNHYKFYTLNLLHIEIGKHPIIYDPWLSDLDKQTVKHSMHSQYEGM